METLDLVAVVPDATFAVYVGVPNDVPKRPGIFEPVCTHPDQRRKCLARVLTAEGIRRLILMAAAKVMVSTGDKDPANKLLDSLEFQRGSAW